MLKTILVAVVCLVAGAYASDLYRKQFSSIDLSNNASSKLAHIPARSQVVNDPKTTNSTFDNLPLKSTKVDLTIFKSPKTPFQFFEILVSLDSSSADELKEYVSSLASDKLEARRQVSWLLAGKYPNEALDFLTTLMNRGDLELAKLMLQCVGQNHAKLAWDWIGANENEIDKMFSGNTGAKYEYKLFVLNNLALTPEEKWMAYEQAQAQALIANGPRKGDKYNLLSVAVNAASSDPEDAVNHAISNVNGGRDGSLFNGALIPLLQTDVIRARDLALQNQDLVDGYTIDQISNKLVHDNQFSEAYNFVNAITNIETKKSSLNALGSVVLGNGIERAKEFVNTIVSDELRQETVGGLVISMAVSGQLIKDQLALLDSAL
jgi:hypothetical protein